MQTRFKYLLFDFDGTLADSKVAFLAAYNQLAAQEGFKAMQVEDLPFLRTLSMAQRARHLHFPLFKLPFFTLRFYRHYKQQLPTISLFPGIREVLQVLAERGVGMAIISSNEEAIIRLFWQAQKLPPVAEVLCSSRLFGKHKMINRFLKEKQLRPGQVLYVGDEVRDLEACHKCGVKMAWVAWGYDALEVVQPAKPSYLIHAPSELLGLL